MDRKLAHFILLIGDIACITALIITCKAIADIFYALKIDSDMIEFSNRICFGVFLPALLLIIHFVILLENLWPQHIRNYSGLLSRGAIALLLIMFVFSITGSIYLRKNVEQAGYIYCEKESRSSKYLTYQVFCKTFSICENYKTIKENKKE